VGLYTDSSMLTVCGHHRDEVMCTVSSGD